MNPLLIAPVKNLTVSYMCSCDVFVPWATKHSKDPFLTTIRQHSYALSRNHRIEKMAKTRTTPFLKWNSNSTAHKMLVAGLLSGTIDPSRRPKDLWESNPEFGRYSLDSFRSAYHRNKHSTGTFIRSDGEQKHVPLLFACFTVSNNNSVDSSPLFSLLKKTNRRRMTHSTKRAPTRKMKTHKRGT
jgi:hypothetical protein